MSADPTTNRQESTDRVEVVADQTADGAYEIRVERTAPSTTGRTRFTAVAATQAKPAAGVRWGALLAITSASMTAAVGGYVATRRSPAPPVVEIEPVETFQAFRVEPLPTLRSAVLYDAGSGAAEAAVPTEGSGQDLAMAPADDVQEAVILQPVEAYGVSAAALAAERAALGEPTPLDARTVERLRAVQVSPSAIAAPDGAAALLGRAGLDDAEGAPGGDEEPLDGEALDEEPLDDELLEEEALEDEAEGP